MTSARKPEVRSKVAPVALHKIVITNNRAKITLLGIPHSCLNWPVRQTHQATKVTAFIQSPSSSPVSKKIRGR